MNIKLSISIAATLLAFSAYSNAAELKLRIMETTDLHMNFLNYDYYQDKPVENFGVNRTIPLIKAARAEAVNSMLFDNGDLIQGNPLGDVIARIRGLKPGETHAAFKVMNQLGYDAANLGNHEFNFGLDFLRQSIATAKFPYVSANVFEGAADTPNAKHAFTPFLILNRSFKDTEGKTHALKIGVIGFTPPQIMQWDRSHLQGKVFTRDIVEMAKRYVPEMKSQGADLVIAIPHSGYERTPQGPMAENAVAGLADVPGIDAILFGHSHAEFPSQQFANHPKVNIAKGTINGVASVMPGRWGDHLGIIDLTLDNASGKWLIKDSQSMLRPIFDRTARKALVESDPLVEAAIKEEHEATLAYVRAKVAESSAPIYSYFAQVADDPSVQIVSNAQIAYVKKALVGTPHANLPILSAAAPFKAGGRQGASFYTDIPAGPIAIKNVADLYIFPNTLKAVLFTGAQVRDWIEMSAGQFNTIDPKGAPEQNLLNPAFPSFNFDTVDGVTYDIDVTQPPKFDTRGMPNTATAVVNPSRVKNLRFNGQPIDLSAKFVVATNNYRAYGGGNFPALGADKVILDAPEENREALVEYLRDGSKAAGGKVNPTADNNWRILGVPGITMTFTSASSAQKFLGNHKNIRLLKEAADGFATFALVP
ncbi:bifunctional 2',3'-cyclic-nucleotide 2'-phosphodiesterase/3'-nucleotidase [Variovorax sp. PCZ-1]|uniref:bifunctional 2',3'-cyclic-nucleotide 2'-phosphodiesterase/3'-nucleotidase n=1 Tax=Variovorax sp. PCZ-1 TaxID=2835533 RepID=UPI001BCAF8DF|nr:bifunctional 2',3'-cyclic-nucleotide 2'-phosphodiesterase/3'-nucleotidase [Variovorax sp. PCZ-1]MBS7807042.1 bifunctional 2',3'-cyclic-nucleotide 2'-phosphodiesterase/3'-nucleotidase [Variovorax sp. PCZ-1]